VNFCSVSNQRLPKSYTIIKTDRAWLRILKSLIEIAVVFVKNLSMGPRHVRKFLVESSFEADINLGLTAVNVAAAESPL